MTCGLSWNQAGFAGAGGRPRPAGAGRQIEAVSAEPTTVGAVVTVLGEAGRAGAVVTVFGKGGGVGAVITVSGKCAAGQNGQT